MALAEMFRKIFFVCRVKKITLIMKESRGAEVMSEVDAGSWGL